MPNSLPNVTDAACRHTVDGLKTSYDQCKGTFGMVHSEVRACQQSTHPAEQEFARHLAAFHGRIESEFQQLTTDINELQTKADALLAFFVAGDLSTEEFLDHLRQFKKAFQAAAAQRGPRRVSSVP
jgi:phage shock protein A